MAPRKSPPFRADHVGSLLRPDELKKAREDADAGKLPAAKLKEIEDRLIREAVKLQEDVGIEAITDGEFRRKHWSNDFLGGIEGIAFTQGMATTFRSKRGETTFRPTALKITSKLKRNKPISVDHFKYLKSVTSKTPKQCIPSPTLVHYRSGRPGIDAKAYPDMGEFYADLAKVYADEIKDLAAAGCRYVQLDDTDFAYLCDPKFRDMAQQIGIDPDKIHDEYSKLINDVIKTKPKDMTIGVHVCRGNHASSWAAEGGYEPVAEALFNRYDFDAYFLEYDSERAGDFRPLRHVPKGNKMVVLGLVTSKEPQLEPKDTLKRRIDEAAKFVPMEQLAISPQCGFASTSLGNLVTVDDEKKKLRLCVEVAKEVWG